jgi:putative endonuclease
MKETKECGIYILANKINTVLYTGVTGKGIKARVWEHKNDLVEGFTRKYKCHKLVYAEICDDMEQAISREKQIKGGSRAKKVKLIESQNPDWFDLYDDLD